MNIWNKIVRWFGKDDYYLTEVEMDVCMDFINPDLEPRYGNDGDAGLDVFAYEFVRFWGPDNQKVHIDEMIEEFILKPGQRLMISTGISADIPKKIGFLALPRSGVTSEYGIMLINSPGLIDNIYKGRFCFVFYNASQVDYKFRLGDKIGQILPFYQIKVKYRKVDKVGESCRGSSGFGSTGV